MKLSILWSFKKIQCTFEMTSFKKKKKNPELPTPVVGYCSKTTQEPKLSYCLIKRNHSSFLKTFLVLTLIHLPNVSGLLEGKVEKIEKWENPDDDLKSHY